MILHSLSPKVQTLMKVFWLLWHINTCKFSFPPPLMYYVCGWSHAWNVLVAVAMSISAIVFKMEEQYGSFHSYSFLWINSRFITMYEFVGRCNYTLVSTDLEVISFQQMRFHLLLFQTRTECCLDDWWGCLMFKYWLDDSCFVFFYALHTKKPICISIIKILT